MGSIFDNHLVMVRITLNKPNCNILFLPIMLLYITGAKQKSIIKIAIGIIENMSFIKKLGK